MSFSHLHVLGTHSLLCGVGQPAEYARRAAELGQTRLALTDHSTLMGGLAHQRACKEHGLTPIFGTTVSVWPAGVQTITPATPDGGWQLVLLCQDDVGYQHLCQLLTEAAKHQHFRPRIDLELLQRHQKGLYVLTSTLYGPLGLAQPDELAEASLARLKALLAPGQLYVELANNGPAYGPFLARAVRLATQLDLPVVATGDVQHVRPEDVVTLLGLRGVLTHTALDAQLTDTVTDQGYLCSEEELRQRLPEALQAAVDRAGALASSCHATIRTGTYIFPSTSPPEPLSPEDEWVWLEKTFPPPAPVPSLHDPEVGVNGSLIERYFRASARAGFLRLEIHENEFSRYRERLDMELGVICGMGFAPYFLIVGEFIGWARSQNIPVGPGRGSAAGSIVSWALGITELDPVRFGLHFERFLNPERKSMPDIDVDFAQDGRERVIQHVVDKYGQAHVARIPTLMAFKPKAAMKDAARLLGVHFDTANEWTSRLAEEKTIELALALSPLEQLVGRDPLFTRVVHVAQALEGRYRQLGLHAAGVVIAERPLAELAPLSSDDEGRPVIGLDMNDVEKAGLIKFDFLGVETLDVLRDAVENVRRTTGQVLDLVGLPLDDEETLKLLQAADTAGVFQLERSGMQRLVRRLHPDTIEEVIAILALYRPGPLESGMTESFVDRKRKEEPVEYLHPDLEPHLSVTYGLMVYQEQVLKVAQVLAGMSLGQADLLRRAIGKKKKNELEAQRAVFLDGCERVGKVSRHQAEGIFGQIEKFANYGFNLAHAAAYGVITWRCAWIKAHHPDAFLASVLTHTKPADKARLSRCLRECQIRKIRILPPDINESGVGFDLVAKGAIRFGLRGLHGVGEVVAASVLRERARHGPFLSLHDLGERLPKKVLNKASLTALADCGALDRFDVPREHALELARPDPPKRKKARKDPGQQALFDTPKEHEQSQKTVTLSERLAREQAVLGVSVSGHPLDPYMGIIRRTCTCTVPQIESRDLGERIRVAGVVLDRKLARTKAGRELLTFTLADQDGQVSLSMSCQERGLDPAIIQKTACYVISGRILKAGKGRRFVAETIEPLDAMRERMTRSIILEIIPMDANRLPSLPAILKAHPGAIPVHVQYRRPDALVRFSWPKGPVKVSPSQKFFRALELAFGRSDIAMTIC